MYIFHIQVCHWNTTHPNVNMYMYVSLTLLMWDKNFSKKLTSEETCTRIVTDIVRKKNLAPLKSAPLKGAPLKGETVVGFLRWN